MGSAITFRANAIVLPAGRARCAVNRAQQERTELNASRNVSAKMPVYAIRPPGNVIVLPAGPVQLVRIVVRTASMGTSVNRSVSAITVPTVITLVASANVHPDSWAPSVWTRVRTICSDQTAPRRVSVRMMQHAIRRLVIVHARMDGQVQTVKIDYVRPTCSDQPVTAHANVRPKILCRVILGLENVTVCPVGRLVYVIGRVRS